MAKKAPEEFYHAGIERIKVDVENSMVSMECQWCGDQHLEAEGMETHLTVHIQIDTTIMIVQALRMLVEEAKEIR